MSVYVDPLMGCLQSVNWKWAQSCHMFADTLEELHVMAWKIGLKRKWFQDKRVPHYDLNPGRRKVAFREGVIELSREETVNKWREKGWSS